MGTRGYVAYRDKRKYYRQFIRCDTYPYDCGHGKRLAKTIPRTPVALKDKNPATAAMAFGTTYDNEWTFPEDLIEWTYAFDLDNMVFTVNGSMHFRLDNMPPTLDYYYREEPRVPIKYIRDTVDLWPCLTLIPKNDNKTVLIEITHHWLRHTSDLFSYAYAASVRQEIGRFDWDILGVELTRQQELTVAYFRSERKPVEDKSIKYFWVSGCLVTICVRPGGPIYVAHEVEKMVTKIRDSGLSESVGIILSSQMVTYVALCGVSRSIRSVCVANPRVGNYTVLHKVPGLDMLFAVQSIDDGTIKTIQLKWKTVRTDQFDHGKWAVREVLTEEVDKLREKSGE
ncbi:hypothetical protein B0J17DRAFT_708432 [Rhizoctonia solani]|nr:hypothetical protein B0J17DRAFT_708432 [Rhizoctonia solani]